jgi:hypothetical protein
MKFSPASFCVIWLRSKYSPLHAVLDHTQSIVVFWAFIPLTLVGSTQTVEAVSSPRNVSNH